MREGYARFPETVKHYCIVRTVEAPEKKSFRITFTRREKNPRMVAARLSLAKAILHNAHWWLDEHRVPERPIPKTFTDDEEEAGRQLSRLLIWRRWKLFGQFVLTSLL